MTTIPYQIISCKNQKSIVLFYFEPSNSGQPQWLYLNSEQGHFYASKLLRAITEGWAHYSEYNCKLQFMTNIKASKLDYDLIKSVNNMYLSNMSYLALESL
jgi:hypothetical protein